MTILTIEIPSQPIKRVLTPSESVKDSLRYELSACRRYIVTGEFGGFINETYSTIGRIGRGFSRTNYRSGITAR